jgi:hypothetical protein
MLNDLLEFLDHDPLTPEMVFVDETTGLRLTILAPDRLQLEYGNVCEIWVRDPSSFLFPAALD